MNGGEALVATLISHGLDTGFCVPGESYLAVLEALRRERGRFRLITNRHESGAAFAAEAYGKLTAKPGLAFVTRGPGATNASIGIHAAAQDSTPMVLFVGQVPRAHRGLEAFQEIDCHTVFGNLAKAVVEPGAADEISATTSLALGLAVSGRPGPVVVVLPEDLTEGDAGAPRIVPAVGREAIEPAADAVAEACRLVTASRYPVVISGELVAAHSAHRSLEEFVGATGAGVVTSFRRQDTFANSHPAYLGHFGLGRASYQRRAWAECDLVIAAGNRLDSVTCENFTLFREDQKLIHIYVDDNVVGRHRQADVALNADVGPALDALAAGLAGSCTDDRLAWCEKFHRAYREFAATGPPTIGAVDLASVVHTVSGRLDRDHVIANDAGNFAGWVHRCFEFRQPHSQAGPGSGAMGAGVPAAIGAQFARPEATVVAFVGDGGFQMTGAEIATALAEDLPIKIIVCDNGAYGTILMHQRRQVGEEYAVRIGGPDFAALARAHGAAAWSVNKTEEFSAAFDAALAHPGPTLIHVKTDVRDISAFGSDGC